MIHFPFHLARPRCGGGLVVESAVLRLITHPDDLGLPRGLALRIYLSWQFLHLIPPCLNHVRLKVSIFLSLAQLSLISPAQSSGHNPLSRGVRLSTLWLYSSQAGRCARDGGFENNMRMGRFFGAKRVTGIVAAKLGHCPRCMRQSFVIAVIAWVCAMAACAMAWPVLTITFGILALGLSGLWLAHLATFAARVVVKVERNADSATNDPASCCARMPRRQFFRTFAKAFTFAAIATAVSTRTALACVQPPIACTKHSDCTCSGCCGDMDGIHLCQPSC